MQRLYVCPTDGLIHPSSCITGTRGYGLAFIGPIFSPGTDGENTSGAVSLGSDWEGLRGCDKDLCRAKRARTDAAHN